ncbi:MAG: DsbA family protein [Bacteroidetes bacterium]|nr:MAG: DsbA family protein [Bacteroidota bacterium]
MNTNDNNPLLCSPESGACEVPATGTADNIDAKEATAKPVQIIYFTDPICSSCWGIEPQLRRLKLEYGDYINIEYHMGGLLPGWENFYSGGITKPSDVAHHWDEVSLHYEMPIDGDVWLEDPLSSSYPPSIAFIAAQLQNKAKAVKFLRHIREMVFLEKKNITKWEHLKAAAEKAGLDTVQLKKDYEGQANQLFKNDLDYARTNGVRGFPTLFFVDSSNNRQMLYGARPYQDFERILQFMYPDAVKKPLPANNELFNHYPTLTAKEFAVLTGQTISQSTQTLDNWVADGMLEKHNTKNGALWKLKK